MNTPIPG